MDDYSTKTRQYDAVMTVVEKLCEQMPEVVELLKIKSVGLVTLAGFIAKVGDVQRFESPKQRQIQKLAGLAIRENSSGKYRGQTTILRYREKYDDLSRLFNEEM